jgi:hypothetical protein
MLGRVRRFLQRRAWGDPGAELRFWLEQWEPHIRSGSLFSLGGTLILNVDIEAEATAAKPADGTSPSSRLPGWTSPS